MTNITEEITKICQKVKAANAAIANLSTDVKNQILLKVASEIKDNIPQIIAANNIDTANAKANNIAAAKLDRLTLDEKRITAIANAVEDVAQLDDPVGKITYEVNRSNGLHIRRITTPLGVIAAIYESRPNVTSDIAALAFKSGNCALLRSGSESYNSSKAIAAIYNKVLQEFGIDENVIHYIDSTDRQYVQEMLKMDQYIDVVIPRGGKELIKAISENTKIPIFKHLDGNCHSYVQSAADLDKACKIVVNAKMRRTGICGATESLVIDQAIAEQFLPKIIDQLAKLDCEVRGDAAAMAIDGRVKQASEADFYTEYLDKIISVKIVKDINEAIAHINKHSSSHTESIITEDQQKAQQFFNEINSAIVMHNASTQFADGGEFGLGAEVGISTGKLHARGPVGLEQLVTYKYIVDANCATRSV